MANESKVKVARKILQVDSARRDVEANVRRLPNTHLQLAVEER